MPSELFALLGVRVPFQRLSFGCLDFGRRPTDRPEAGQDKMLRTQGKVEKRNCFPCLCARARWTSDTEVFKKTDILSRYITVDQWSSRSSRHAAPPRTATTAPAPPTCPRPADHNQIYCWLEKNEQNVTEKNCYDSWSVKIKENRKLRWREQTTLEWYKSILEWGGIDLIPLRPRLLAVQSSRSGSGLEESITKCCRSRHVKLRLASRASARMAAAIGADAEVPVCWTVQAS